MLAPNLTTADFVAALSAFLPRGRVWPKSPDSVQGQALFGFAGLFAKNSSDASALLADIFPPSTYELLPEWEATLGLPDPLVGQLPTIRQRVAMVVERFCNGGGQSVPYIIGFAANLGYTITITEFSPSRVGQSRAGSPLNAAAWSHAWRVNVATNTVSWSRIGATVAGEPICVWGNTQLWAELARVCPAHTILMTNLT